jgi:uncharacterized protein (TIGR02594 family)
MIPTPDQLRAAPWMAAARAELGVREVDGEERNSDRVLEYLRSCTGPRPLLARDTTPWCSAFANWCMQQVHLPRTRSLAARSWLRYGDAVLRPDLRYGDVIVLWRGLKLGPQRLNAPGHVGFADHWTDQTIWLLGGNQGNRVSVQPYPWTRVIGIRRPSAVTLAIRSLEGEEA